MPFNPKLAKRLEEVIKHHFTHISGLTETRMMGGFGYFLNGNMCLGIHKDTLMIRIGTKTAEKVLKEPYVRPMDLTGKVMKGWATVEPKAMKTKEDLIKYCTKAIEFVKTLPTKKKSTS